MTVMKMFRGVLLLVLLVLLATFVLPTAVFAQDETTEAPVITVETPPEDDWNAATILLVVSVTANLILTAWSVYRATGGNLKGTAAALRGDPNFMELLNKLADAVPRPIVEQINQYALATQAVLETAQHVAGMIGDTAENVLEIPLPEGADINVIKNRLQEAIKG